MPQREREPKLWVDIPKTTLRYPGEQDTLPDFVLHTPENTLIALYGKATWETLDFCLSSALQLLDNLAKLVDAIKASCKNQPVRDEVSVLHEIIQEHLAVVKSLSETKLPAALSALEDIFVPHTRLHDMRVNIGHCLVEMADIGTVLEAFVDRGMKKRLRLFRSAALFKDGRLEHFGSAARAQYAEFEKNLSSLVDFCHSGGRFNVMPDGGVRSSPGVVLGSNRFEDPQVVLDEATQFHDNLENYQDALEMLGAGPRRTPNELGEHVVIRLGNGQSIVI